MYQNDCYSKAIFTVLLCF